MTSIGRTNTSGEIFENEVGISSSLEKVRDLAENFLV
jgi:hypothetical protein